jgi:hypothetical protein
MSSMKTTTKLSMYSMNTLFIRYMKYPGAFVNPKGMIVNSYKAYLDVKAVLGMSSNWIFS